ncbi:histidine kinase [Anabaena sphaerica FACHB-251]|uniref:Histidine kinase n=1 Tax=Anabaena sphaerica FACHB-251 TaxID=2692883 RepID=A0A926WI55_9NOST|nr:general stress protein [Anabaena sphaerica]MBD2294976.1 histidine kinase [Anabaena sphaerica FACHB-251]
MITGIHKRAVGVFPDRRDAEQALHELRNSGFPMERVSVIARHNEGRDDIAGQKVHEKVGDQAEEGATTGAVSGGVVGGITGLLVGLGALAIPGIGPIMLAGATATALATTLAGAGIGAAAGGLIGGLIGLGIPEERAKVYHGRVERGEYLVIIDGTDAEIARAKEILHRWRIEEFEVYDQPDGKQPTRDVIHQDVAVHRDVPVHKDVTVHKNAIGYFSRLQDAEAAINELRNAGFPLTQIALIHREPQQKNAFSGIPVSDRFESTRFNISEQHTRFYNESIHQGNYIIIVSGTDADINRAAAILNRHGIKQWQVYESNGHVNAPLQTTKRAIGVFSHRRDAEAALGELRSAGFPMNQVSLIAKDIDNGGQRHQEIGNQADEGLKTGAATGGALGGLAGLLVGLGTLAIPGVGPVMAGGAVATALATTLTGGAVGAAVGGIAGGLIGLGIPEERARVYNDRFQRGHYLVIADGTEAQIHHAERILQGLGIEEFAIYDAHDVSEHQPSFEPVRHTETVRSNFAGEPPVVIVDHRERTV